MIFINEERAVFKLSSLSSFACQSQATRTGLLTVSFFCTDVSPKLPYAAFEATVGTWARVQSTMEQRNVGIVSSVADERLRRNLGSRVRKRCDCRADQSGFCRRRPDRDLDSDVRDVGRCRQPD